MKLISLESDERDTIVICEGHVDKAAFATRVDTDDVVALLGDDYEGAGDNYPSPDDEARIADMIRHSQGIWITEGKLRRWEECHNEEPGAQPFTVLDQEGNP